MNMTKRMHIIEFLRLASYNRLNIFSFLQISVMEYIQIVRPVLEEEHSAEPQNQQQMLATFIKRINDTIFLLELIEYVFNVLYRFS